MDRDGFKSLVKSVGKYSEFCEHVNIAANEVLSRSVFHLKCERLEKCWRTGTLKYFHYHNSTFFKLMSKIKMLPLSLSY